MPCWYQPKTWPALDFARRRDGKGEDDKKRVRTPRLGTGTSRSYGSNESVNASY
jgi:hypothetical protein